MFALLKYRDVVSGPRKGLTNTRQDFLARSCAQVARAIEDVQSERITERIFGQQPLKAGPRSSDTPFYNVDVYCHGWDEAAQKMKQFFTCLKRRGLQRRLDMSRQVSHQVMVQRGLFVRAERGSGPTGRPPRTPFYAKRSC